MTKKTSAPLVTIAPGPVRLTVEQIAKDTGLSPRVVKKNLAIAEKAGWLQVNRVGRNVADYAVTIPERYKRA
jgi:predicted transcriptional regulator